MKISLNENCFIVLYVFTLFWTTQLDKSSTLADIVFCTLPWPKWLHSNTTTYLTQINIWWLEHLFFWFFLGLIVIMDCSKLISLFGWFGTGLFIILLPGNIFVLLVTKLFCLGSVIMFLFTCSTNKYYTLTHFLVEE